MQVRKSLERSGLSILCLAVIPIKNNIIMKTKVLSEVIYKRHSIKIIEDKYGHEFAIIDGDKGKLYASVSDAKCVIDGQEPKGEIL